MATYEDYTGIVPEHYTGKETVAHAVTELQDENEAQVLYDVAKQRLLNVNNWHKVAGIISATFQLIDDNGKQAERNVQQGDYIRVDIPGPGSKEGNGYDWVYVEQLKEVTNGVVKSIGFRVRPTANPFGSSEHIAHFYDDTATSNFMITKKGTAVKATIIDSNLQVNDDTRSLTDTLRHTIVGKAAISMFSKIQWQNLANGFVEGKH